MSGCSVPSDRTCGASVLSTNRNAMSSPSRLMPMWCVGTMVPWAWKYLQGGGGQAGGVMTGASRQWQAAAGGITPCSQAMLHPGRGGVGGHLAVQQPATHLSTILCCSISV